MATLNRTYTPPPPRTLVRSVGMPGSGSRHRAGAPPEPPGRRPFMPAPQRTSVPLAVAGTGPLTRGQAALAGRYGLGSNYPTTEAHCREQGGQWRVPCPPVPPDAPPGTATCMAMPYCHYNVAPADPFADSVRREPVSWAPFPAPPAANAPEPEGASGGSLVALGILGLVAYAWSAG